MTKVVKPRNIIASSNVDDPMILSTLVNELEDYLADQFEDNLVMQFAPYIDDDYTGDDIDNIVRKYNAAKMQYLMCTAKLICRGNWV